MKRVVGLCVVLIVLPAVTTSSAVAGGERRQKVQTAEYIAPALGLQNHPVYNDWFAFCFTTSKVGCVRFKTPRGARTVELEIDDASMQPVVAYVHQGPNGSAPADPEIARICGKTEKPLRLLNDQPVWAVLLNGECEDGRLSVATRGTVTATFGLAKKR